MTLFLPKLTSTRSNAFLNLNVSLNDYSSPLHVQNKANSRATFSTFFFSFDLFQGTAKPQNRRGKLESKWNSTIYCIIVLKQLQSPIRDGNQRWHFMEHACSYCITKMFLWKYRGFLMLYVINFGHVLKLLDFGKRYFTAINDWKQKYCETATSTQRENKTVRQIGLLNLRWYQRNYWVFAPFLNSVAVRVYINGVDLFFCLFVCFFRNDFKSDYKLSYWWILFRTELKKEKCSKTLRRKKIVQSCKK